ncbi:hypothetical protein Poli38472_007486 [Pythium oligandrum]|uniref:FYVE-type domain-containing protein n=1 Tax=Pythium oligandrum TaxID=41045 RepID=A0A8K1FNY5_PYTOL|nr:hypothetical protein Poli38472_007486 [Pythium oligandrum]|eukprot:TMW67814.1 hypothetical protein Poli38472_007486 [Pythium oligandrum]
MSEQYLIKQTTSMPPRTRENWTYLDAPYSEHQQRQHPQPPVVNRTRKAVSNADFRPQSAQMRRLTSMRDPGGNDLGSGMMPHRLSKKEKSYLIRRAKESSMSLIEHANTLEGPVQWVYKGKHRGIQMYRGEGSATLSEEADQLEYLCGVTTMMGTLEEVSEYFDQSTTPRMRMKKADDVVDCAVIYSLIAGNTVNPFHRVSVKYCAYDSVVSMSRKRDFCYLECQDTFRHTSGRRGWVLSMHSIKLPCCPEVPGYVRGSMYHSGFVFIESERPGYMDVLHSLQLNFKGNGRMPTMVLNNALKRRLRDLIHISREIQVARVANHTLLNEKELVPKNLRSTCVLCSRKFWLLLRKTRCRVCGEVVCQACAPEIDWEGPDHNGQSKTRVCIRCSSAPTTSSWSANSEELPWTEQSRLIASEKKIAVHSLTPKSAIVGRYPVLEEEPEDDDDGIGEGRFTFAELEEQSSRSVFAPERFTRTSTSSTVLALEEIDDIGEYEDDEDESHSVHSSDFEWQPRPTEESVTFDHRRGSFASSVASSDNQFSRTDTSMRAARYITAAPALIEEPDVDQVSHVNASSRRVSTPMAPIPQAPAPTPAPAPAPAPTPSRPPPRAPTPPLSSSYDYLDALIALPPERPIRSSKRESASRKRAQTEIESRSALTASVLREHNMQFSPSTKPEAPVAAQASVIASTHINMDSTPENEPVTPVKGAPVSLDDIVRSESSQSGDSRFSGSVDLDRSTLSRPSSLILQQVRKNRARTIQMQPEDQMRSTEMFKSVEEEHKRRMAELNKKAQVLQPEDQVRDTEMFKSVEEEHKRRMAELNQKALDYTGNRVSNLQARPSLMPETVDDEAWRSSSMMDAYRVRRMNTIDALRQKATALQNSRESLSSEYSARTSTYSTSSYVGPSSDFYGDPRLSEDPSMAPVPFSDRLTEKYQPSGVKEAPTNSFMPITAQYAPDPIPEPEPEYKSLPVRPPPPQPRPAKQAPAEPVSGRNLYQELSQLSKLRNEMAETSDQSEHDRLQAQIKEQYQLIRALKLKN